MSTATDRTGKCTPKLLTTTRPLSKREPRDACWLTAAFEPRQLTYPRKILVVLPNTLLQGIGQATSFVQSFFAQLSRSCSPLGS